VSPEHIYTLLRANAGLLDDDGAPPNKSVVGDLMDAELLNFDASVSGRGAAFIASLIQTPLPIMQWVDPRETYPYTSVRLDPPPHARPTPAQERALKASVDTSVFAALPAGFTSIPDLKPGELPPGVNRDGQIELYLANGKTIHSLAGTINWANKGKKDSPIGMRIVNAKPDTELSS